MYVPPDGRHWKALLSAAPTRDLPAVHHSLLDPRICYHMLSMFGIVGPFQERREILAEVLCSWKECGSWI